MYFILLVIIPEKYKEAEAGELQLITADYPGTVHLGLILRITENPV